MRLAVCVPVFALALALAAGSAPARGEGGSPGGEAGWSGRTDLRHRSRVAHSDADSDLFDVTRLEWRDAERGGERVHLVLHGAGWADLNGLAGEGEADRLRDRRDAYEGAVQGALYSAYADLSGAGPHALGALETLRAGRQFVYRGETLHFDGIYIETRPATALGLQPRAYGGVPVRLSTASPRGDWLGGGGLALRPVEPLGLALDGVHIEDNGLRGANDYRTDLGVATARLDLSEALWLDGGGSMVGGDQRRLWGRATLDWADPGLLVSVDGVQSRETLRDYATDVSPYFPIQALYRPYDEGRALVTKTLGEHAALEAGGQVRRLVDEAEASPYNREFERGFATLHLEELLPGNEIALTGERWDDDGSGVTTGGVDLAQRFLERWRVAGGYEHALYKYDRVTGEEREGVRTAWLEGRHDPSKAWRVQARYEREEDDSDVYQLVELGVRHVF